MSIEDNVETMFHRFHRFHVRQFTTFRPISQCKCPSWRVWCFLAIQQQFGSVSQDCCLISVISIMKNYNKIGHSSRSSSIWRSKISADQRTERKKRKNRQLDKKKKKQTKKQMKTDRWTKKRHWTKKEDRHTKRKKNRQTVEGDHKGIIFASLYTTLKKWVISFYRGQINAIVWSKKSYFGHTFHLRPKKVSWWVVGGWKVTLVSVCVHFLKLLDTQTYWHRNGHRAWQQKIFFL